MVYKATLRPGKSKLVANDDGTQDSTDITITVQWDASDTALTTNDSYTITHDHFSFGSVTPTDTAPADVKYTSADATSRTATAALKVTGKTFGECVLNGNLTGRTTVAKTQITISIVPTSIKIFYTSFSPPAIPTSDKPATPAGNPDGISRLTVTAVNSKNAPVANYPIVFSIDNVRSQDSKVTGAFFNGSTPVNLVREQPGADLSTATATIVTDAHGIATLSVVANNIDGYISCRPLTIDGPVGDAAFVYIFSETNGGEPFPISLLTGDISDYQDTTFDVKITNAAVQRDEFIGLFLNGKFQKQTIGAPFNSGTPVFVTASVSDLIVSDDLNQKNTIFYSRTQKGDLFNSRQQTFNTTGTVTPIGPQPNEPVILTSMVSPNGGVINNGSINNPDGTKLDFPAIMNVLADVTIVSNERPPLPALAAGQFIRIFTKFQGDYIDTDQFTVTFKTYDYQLKAADLTSDHVTVNIPYNDINGYGVPKDGRRTSEYTMWYGYLVNQTDAKTFASSPIVRGVLSTRRI